ncbi:MAG: 3,4-dihydroxy-2-butanone-4-phosphate synthase [Thermoplasmatota archaeon]
MSDSEVDRAVEAMGRGEFVLVYDADGREEECDFFLAAEFCRPDHIRTMRQDGGGLIFLMVRPDVRDRFALPFLQDMYPELNISYPVIKALVPDDIPYDSRSSFSLTINHRKTFTVIMDDDRALTVSEFGNLALATYGMSEAQALPLLGEKFRSPGHIAICISSDRVLETRFGHTELSCALSTMGGLSGVSVGCEIMGSDGKARSKEDVILYARERGIPFLEGKQIIEAWRDWDGEWKRTYMPPVKNAVRIPEAADRIGSRSVVVPPKTGIRVLATGVFDLLHPGHLHYLNEAKALGDELVVVVARDSTVKEMKHHPVTDERIRRQMVEGLKMTDWAVLGYEGDRIRIVRELQPDVIALGHDQLPDEKRLREELSETGLDIEVVRLTKSTGDLHGTSRIIEKIRGRGDCD